MPSLKDLLVPQVFRSVTVAKTVNGHLEKDLIELYGYAKRLGSPFDERHRALVNSFPGCPNKVKDGNGFKKASLEWGRRLFDLTQYMITHLRITAGDNSAGDDDAVPGLAAVTTDAALNAVGMLGDDIKSWVESLERICPKHERTR
ncbi:hypothetical protein K461DRAFT_312723 [Myriangium duriaei CBS 260.36]|uniref:Uncharacterized protein n=1 Tax=Myriangium duriaei CBS 260.36 TaxID=1168546 RepID=A0A9P4MHK6_9PEZI|nr:hypothetical protein K461DRAFT_312723 [Myriangium duriaei CBS 260.36]